MRAKKSIYHQLETTNAFSYKGDEDNTQSSDYINIHVKTKVMDIRWVYSPTSSFSKTRDFSELIQSFGELESEEELGTDFVKAVEEILEQKYFRVIIFAVVIPYFIYWGVHNITMSLYYLEYLKADVENQGKYMVRIL